MMLSVLFYLALHQFGLLFHLLVLRKGYWHMETETEKIWKKITYLFLTLDLAKDIIGVSFKCVLSPAKDTKGSRFF